MIGKLSGRVDTTGTDWAIIDVGGVGYIVTCSTKTLARLGTGMPASIWVETRMREDAIQLFGFYEAGERDWFRLLTTVQGVGARVALAILSTLTADQLTLAIASGDKAALARADGVGPKLAQRVALELKDKAGGIGRGGADPLAPSGPLPAAGSGVASDAVSALVNLGYGRMEAFSAVGAAAKRAGEAAAVGDLIREALKELAQ